MTTDGTAWGGFDFSIDYEVDREQVGGLHRVGPLRPRRCANRRPRVPGDPRP